MKDFGEFESRVIEQGEHIKRSLGSLMNNMGRVVALIAALITVTVTFTDISFASLSPANTLPTLMLLLSSSYIIYFSLEDSGERLGESSAEYKEAKEKYDLLAAKISGEDIESLRDFLEGYTKEELEYRRRRMLLYHGLSDSELEKHLKGEEIPKKNKRIIRRALRLKPASLTAASLLSGASEKRMPELENPERGKLRNLLLGLLPSTLCMMVTVSVILNVKSGMSIGDVLNALIKLSSLPLIGFRGYSAGYSFSKNTRAHWYKTRANVIEAFLKEAHK